MSPRTYACFGLGINNFATARIRVADLIATIHKPPKFQVVASFGPTGNVVVKPQSDSKRGLPNYLRQATGKPWAVVDFQRLIEALDALDAYTKPPDQPGVIRWTPGLAFVVEGRANARPHSTRRAHYRLLDPSIVLIHKRDRLEGSTLDPLQRQGGWGALAAEVGRQVGGIWTARSYRSICGLMARYEARSACP